MGNPSSESVKGLTPAGRLAQSPTLSDSFNSEQTHRFRTLEVSCAAMSFIPDVGILWNRTI
jgi:hypothetical protein